MSDQTNVKVFTVSGEAAGAMGGTRKRRKRSTAKMETLKVGHEAQKGGTSPGTSLQIEANKTSDSPPVFKNSTADSLAKTTTDSSPAPAKGGALPKPPPLAQEGGAKPIKVSLEKKKKLTNVILSPTKVKKLNPATVAATTVSTSGTSGKTRKMAKKIRMSLNGFGKRVTRANSIRVEAKKSSVEDLKKTLVEAKLIKTGSKAPESVLRQMYSDYMMLKNRAL